jgi:hypothetical protein
MQKIEVVSDGRLRLPSSSASPSSQINRRGVGKTMPHLFRPLFAKLTHLNTGRIQIA